MIYEHLKISLQIKMAFSRIFYDKQCDIHLNLVIRFEPRELTN